MKKQTSPEAVNQQQLSVMTALVGKEIASYLVPNYNEGQKLAIIDEGVLKYLKELLPKATAETIIRQLYDELYDIRFSDKGDKLELAVKSCKDFIAFHESINLLKKYFDPTMKIEYEEPFNQPVRELTISEMVEQYNTMAGMLAQLDAQIKAHPEYKGEAQPVVEVVEVVKPVIAAPSTFNEWRMQEGKDSNNRIIDYRVYLHSDTFKDYFNMQYNDGKLTELMNEAYKSQA